MLVNMHEAKTHLSRLIERAAAGEEIIIGKAGKPMAKLCPLDKQQEPLKFGEYKGRIWMSPDFDELPPEVDAAFRGESS